MPERNRVTPTGEIVAAPLRGAWTGNRGVLHEGREIVRFHAGNLWITCALEFRGRHRELWLPNRWTPLFFLDEAVAFAAGHRPCFECRRADADRFKTLWLKANPAYHFDERTPIREIDNILHKERIRPDGTKTTYTEGPAQLPNGAFIVYEDLPYLVHGGLIHQWTPFGYEKGKPLPRIDRVTILTPRSITNTFRAGYIPQMAISR